jgi:hypothetical protein
MEKGYLQSGFTRNFGKEICDLPKTNLAMQGLCEKFHKVIISSPLSRSASVRHKYDFHKDH